MLCGALLYGNTLLNDFIYTYDDGTQILKNPYVHSFGHLREIFFTNVWSYLAQNTVTNYYRPMMTVGYLLCYKAFGPFTYGFHLTSVVLHSALACLIFLGAARRTLDRALAFVAALLFPLHPVHPPLVLSFPPSPS